MRVLGTGGADAREVPHPCGRDVEAHAEEPELPVTVVARPSGSERVLKLVECQAGPVVDYPNLSLGRVAVPAGERDGDTRTLTVDGVPKELVEAVVDELGDALPRRERDVPEDGEDPRVRAQVDAGSGLGHVVLFDSCSVSYTLPPSTDRMGRLARGAARRSLKSR
ncbi:MAG: hypothetical protein Q8R60_14710 [Mycobacteriales bacterium]|nr:hypothetical protein [Mycobacteriales bacterium]